MIQVKGGLLRPVVEEAEQVHKAEVVEIDVSATHPVSSAPMVELGFLAGRICSRDGFPQHQSLGWSE